MLQTLGCLYREREGEALLAPFTCQIQLIRTSQKPARRRRCLLLSPTQNVVEVANTVVDRLDRRPCLIEKQQMFSTVS